MRWRQSTTCDMLSVCVLARIHLHEYWISHYLCYITCISPPESLSKNSSVQQQNSRLSIISQPSLIYFLPSFSSPKLNMANGTRSDDSGATGRPTLTSLIEKATGTLMRAEQRQTMAPPTRPAVQVNGLPAVSDLSTPITPAQERDAVKLNMLRRIRPPPFKYAWAFYHDKHSPSADYEGRLTTMLDNIITIKTFWEVFNQFPLDALKMKDAVHFFKRGVKPVWEDPRNITGGSWTFRVPKAQSGEFWKETLLLAVGEQFVDVIQPRKS